MRNTDRSKASNRIHMASKLRNQCSACYDKRCSSVCKAKDEINANPEEKSEALTVSRRMR